MVAFMFMGLTGVFLIVFGVPVLIIYLMIETCEVRSRRLRGIHRSGDHRLALGDMASNSEFTGERYETSYVG